MDYFFKTGINYLINISSPEFSPQLKLSGCWSGNDVTFNAVELLLTVMADYIGLVHQLGLNQ